MMKPNWYHPPSRATLKTGKRSQMPKTCRSSRPSEVAPFHSPQRKSTRRLHRSAVTLQRLREGARVRLRLMRRIRTAALLVTLLASLTAACGSAPGGDASTTAAATAASTPVAPTGTAWGIAGITPRGFPRSTTPDDWRAYYESIAGLGGWQGAFGAWTKEEGLPSVIRTQAGVAAQYRFRSIPLIGFHRDAGPGKVALTVDFRDEAQATAFTQAVATLAREQRPAFLGVGNEVNRIAEQEAAAYEAWVKRLPAIAEAVHAASPETKVFTTYQLEMLLGRAGLSGRPAGEARWALLDGVAAAVDVVAFTTYPYFDYATPEAVPASYYRDAAAEAARRGARAVAISEAGWPGAVIPALRGDPRDGSPEEQAAFVRRLPLLFEGVRPAFFLWAFDHDPGLSGTPFDTAGLRANDGTSRPAFDAWRDVVRQR